MKRILLTFTIFSLFTIVLLAQSSSQILQDALREGVEAKVSSMQEQIKFTHEQAEQIKQIEMEFLTGVQKAEKCFLCNKKKKVAKLEWQRDEKLQKILSRNDYLKYDLIQSKRIKDIPVIL